MLRTLPIFQWLKFLSSSILKKHGLISWEENSEGLVLMSLTQLTLFAIISNLLNRLNQFLMEFHMEKEPLSWNKQIKLLAKIFSKKHFIITSKSFNTKTLSSKILFRFSKILIKKKMIKVWVKILTSRNGVINGYWQAVLILLSH